MALVQQTRDLFMGGVGLLAASFNLVGVNASNNQMNYRPVERFYYSEYLHDGMIIRQFYVYETLTHHSFVVFQTETGQTFKVHLVADLLPEGYSPIYVEIKPTYWKPDGRRVGGSNRKAIDLKYFISTEIRKFGEYEVGLNDCRHFARSIAAFLTDDELYIITLRFPPYPQNSGYPYTYPMGNLWTPRNYMYNNFMIYQ
ncbi:unnamed protein product [Adineta ricciae]|uniref:Uncharacterized protein n=1 Tax=Adineta ricciae TaxID=249248 RepID=A0A815EU18_ADIRI|nr:unnamed protein product [Adineta ricciae]